MRVLKTITWDGVVSYNIYRPELVNVIDRLNTGAKFTATQYDIIDVTDEEAMQMGLISKAEMKQKENAEIAKLKAELEALKAEKNAVKKAAKLTDDTQAPYGSDEPIEEKIVLTRKSRKNG